MKKPIKILLKVLLSLLGLVVLVVLIGLLFFRSFLLSFDKDIHYDGSDISELTVEG